MNTDRILLGKIGAAHGIKGEVRITAFTADPLGIADYDPLETDRDGLTISIVTARAAKGVVIATLAGVSDRNAAEALNGVSLFVTRDRLEEPGEDEYYQADLIGLEVRLAEGEVMGNVVAVVNFGADDLLEVRLANTRRTVYLPFTLAVVPVVDIKGGYVSVILPEGWLEETPRDPEDRDPES